MNSEQQTQLEQVLIIVNLKSVLQLQLPNSLLFFDCRQYYLPSLFILIKLDWQ